MTVIAGGCRAVRYRLAQQSPTESPPPAGGERRAAWRCERTAPVLAGYRRDRRPDAAHAAVRGRLAAVVATAIGRSRRHDRGLGTD